ncbi:MAG: hypothetical protein HZB71_00435 [Betaproteobacteria bacterium]|nr:hypothetical protein [Betaproteobacteria bacterium]
MNRIRIVHPPASAGTAWVLAGWKTFRTAPVVWSGMTAMVFMLMLGLGLLPFVGGLTVYLMSPFLVAGFLAASRATEAGEPVTFLHLGVGMATGQRGLLGIGLTYLVATLIVFQIVHYVTGANLEAILAQAHHPKAMTPEEAEAILDQALPALGLGTLLLAPLLMATWFSPGLAHFEEFPAGKAMWWSLWACWVNWRPILYYSMLLGLAGVLALLIPFGLGLLVFLPVTLASTYAAYRDIFVPIEPPAPETEAPPQDLEVAPDFDHDPHP